MHAQSRTYNHKRTLLLCSIYDALEKLGWKLTNSQSDIGIFIVKTRQPVRQYMICVIPIADSEAFHVLVEYKPDGGDSARVKETIQPDPQISLLYNALEDILYKRYIR